MALDLEKYFSKQKTIFYFDATRSQLLVDGRVTLSACSPKQMDLLCAVEADLDEAVDTSEEYGLWPLLSCLERMLVKSSSV